MPSTQINPDFVAKRSNNFDFLEDDFPALYQLALQVERYYLIDSSCCLMKLRLYIELWCRIVGNHLTLFSNTQEELHRQIQILSLSGRLPAHIIDLLNNIRIQANQSVHIHYQANGEWGIAECIDPDKLKGLLKDAFTLTQFLVFTLQGKTVPPDTWVAPKQTVQVEHVYGAMHGDGKAAYQLANQYVELLMSEKMGKSKLSKEDKAAFQQDLSYWLKKARYLHYYKAEYLHAYACVHRLVGVCGASQVREALDQAMLQDQNGKAAFLYYRYLQSQGEVERAFDFLMESGEKSVKEALCLLMEYYYRHQKESLPYWVEKGMAAQLPWAFLLDCVAYLNAWNANRQDDALISKTRGALLSLRNRQIPGWGFFEGWCLISGHLGRVESPKEGIRLMRQHYPLLPSFFDEKERYFDALMVCRDDEECYQDILALAVVVLKLPVSPEKEADRKYHVARVVMRAIKVGMVVPDSLNYRLLIKQAVALKHPLAMQFYRSAEGKIWMRHYLGQKAFSCHKKVDRAKQKRAKKKARKAARLS